MTQHYSQKAPIIGVVITNLFDQYQQMILEGIRYQAERMRARIVCFNAGLVDYFETDSAAKNQIYSLISKETVDAIIVLSGAVLSEKGEKDLQDILQICVGIPTISIGIALAGVYSILVDNSTGIAELCEHLITVHGSRRIAFIRGPQTNDEAEIRFAAFRATLDKYNIPFDPELTFWGNFEVYAGRHAVECWCDERKLHFDTIVSADDQSAIWAMEALRQRGLRVPEDIRVGAFDDIDNSKYTSPPLTTVYQPHFELGGVAVQNALDLIKGHECPLSQTVPTRLVIRGSCGCPIDQCRIDPLAKNLLSLDKKKQSDRPFTSGEELRTFFPCHWDPAQQQVLVSNFNELLAKIGLAMRDGAQVDEVQRKFRQVITESHEMGMTSTTWREILGLIFNSLAVDCASELRNYLQFLWKGCINSLITIEAQINTKVRIDLELEAGQLQLISHRLIGSQELGNIAEVLGDLFDYIGVRECYLALFEADHARASQILAYRKGTCTIDRGAGYPARNLFVPGIGSTESGSYITVPLVIDETHEGFAVFDFSMISRKYETLAERIGTTLRGLFLLEKIHEQNLALRESANEDFRTILNSIGDAVIAVDAQLAVSRMNSFAEKLTGWTFTDANARPIGEILCMRSPQEREALEMSLARIMRDGQASGIPEQIVFCDREGTERLGNYSGAPIRTISAATAGVVLVVRDITEQNRIEEQLRQSQKMESIGLLAGGIAHDFNNMLNGIMGASQMLTRRSGNPESVLKYAASITKISADAAELTHKLLAFSRKTKIEAKTFNLHASIQDAVVIIEHSISKLIEIKLELQAGSSQISGDSSEVQNMLINLCVNARDAMPEGGTLTISTENMALEEDFCQKSSFELSAGDYIALHIRDTGMGMPAAVIKRIFEPFFTTKEIGKGTGLGLAAVYGTVKSHKGSVQVQSQPGQCTVFTIHLPLDPAPQPATDKDASAILQV